MDDRVFQAVLRVAERSNYTGYPDQYPAIAAWDPVEDGDVRRAWRKSLRTPRPLGLYVHIPFCRRKCSFCFLPVWTTGDRRRVERYLSALRAEAGLYADLFKGRSFRSIYIGGGTPTLLDAGELEELLAGLRESFSFTKGCQIAMEANPDSFDGRKARRLARTGLNWVTLGVQSLDPKVLKASGRTHTPAQARSAFRAARAAGIPGVNVDLLFGLPGQTEAGFLRDAARVASWRPDQIHLNTYVNAPKTALARKGLRVRRERFQDCVLAQAKAFEILEAAGYKRFDADSANLTRGAVNWQGARALEGGASILGLGVVAVSYARGALRCVNAKDIRAYAAAVEAGRLPAERGAALTPRREMIQFILTRLEKGGKLSRSEFLREFKTPLERRFRGALKNLRSKGVLREDGGVYRVTDHPGAAFACSRELYEPEIIEKIVERYGLEAAVRR